MGRSQGKQKISSRKTMVRNVDLVRSMLLEDKSYRLRGSVSGMQLFQSPEDLIDLIKAGDFEKFWQEASREEISPIPASGKGLRAIYKDPVFKAFYDGQMRAAERERKSFPNDYYHWMSRINIDDKDAEEMFKEHFARDFVAGLSNPEQAPFGLEGWIFSGKSPVEEYNANLYFQEKYKNLINDNPKNYPELIANSLDPLMSKYGDGYVAESLISGLSGQLARQIVLQDDDDPFLPNEIHNHLNSLLGPSSKLAGDGWVSASSPWRDNGVMNLAREIISKKWKEGGKFPADNLDNITEESYALSLSTQLATIVSRDYRERTRSQNPQEKLSEAIQKVKNKKTMFRRLKPIFESEGNGNVFKEMVKLDKLEKFSASDIADLLNDVSTDFIKECNKNNPPSPNNISLSKIINEKITAF